MRYTVLQNFSKLPIKLLIRCITKAYYLRKTANGVPRGGGRQLLRTLMSVNLTWFKITEELLIKTDSKRKATYGKYFKSNASETLNIELHAKFPIIWLVYYIGLGLVYTHFYTLLHISVVLQVYKYIYRFSTHFEKFSSGPS